MSHPELQDHFDSQSLTLVQKKTASHSARSGTFSDNMKLPVHRWFRYSAGFSAKWVESVLKDYDAKVVLDPFVGSGTVCIACDKFGIDSYGVEAHPFVFRLGSGKTSWDEDISSFSAAISELTIAAKIINNNVIISDSNTLILKCYSKETLSDLYNIKYAYLKLSPEWPESIASLVFLAINSILRSTSNVGTAQWQYILPNKTKARVSNPYDALKMQANMMMEDMQKMQEESAIRKSTLLLGDSRTLQSIHDKSIDLVITSPPYANNYDYADATRLEMSFWGEIINWGDLHGAVRQYLICSSSQHASKEKMKLSALLSDSAINPIRDELTNVCNELDITRKTKGGNKAYHLMIAAYFIDMAKTFQALRRVTKEDAVMCFVIGDSAPYGVHAPVERWFGELALAYGFTSWSFEKIRDRNTKWKNRKHTVPLHEGRLWIFG